MSRRPRRTAARATILRLGVVAAVALSTTIGSPSSPALAASNAMPADGYVGVDGHGWGHAHGLGQWGAKGLADQGKSWTDILSTYYAGTSIATRAAETIRVYLTDAPGVTVASKAPFSVYWSGGAKIADSSDQYPFLRAEVSGGGIAVRKAASPGGPWTTVASGTGQAEFHPGTQTLGLVGSAVRYYRGMLLARRPSGSSTLIAINDLSIEAYLYGVVPREVSSSWAADALRAQAVAARTYAAYKKDAARAAGKLYDICATTSCQVYGGYASASSPSDTPHVLEASSTNDAVNATAGKVVTYQGKAIFAEYSSSTGGYTADGGQPYLKPVPDPADSVSPNHSWTTRVSVAAIQKTWPDIGSLTGIRVTKRNGFGDWGGRVVEMALDGTTRTDTISGDTFRSKMGLKSNWFNVRTYAATLAGSSGNVSGPAGTDIPVSVSLRNAGSAEWRLGGSEILATSPAGRTSRFAGGEWPSPSKAARVAKNLSRSSATTVGSGETAEFRFTLHTRGVPPGTYVETFRPLEDGLTWMNDPGISITVTVLSSWIEQQGNMLTNSSFEAGWSAWRGARVTAADGPATGTSRDGSRSMHLFAGADKAVYQTLSLAGGPGRRVVVGGWARTVGTNAKGGPLRLSVAFRNADGSASWAGVDFSRAPHDWQYVEQAVTAPKEFTRAEVWCTFYHQTGGVYFDGFRLLDTPLANPSFELGTSGWSASGLGSGDGASPNVFADGFRSMHFAGGTKSLTETIPVKGAAGRMYQVSGWTKGNGSDANGMTAIAVVFANHDGTTSRFTIDGVAAAHDWRYVEQQLTAPRSFDRISVSIAVSQQSGSIFFDGIRLRENRLENGSFELGLSPWAGTGAYGSGDGVTSALSRDATESFRLAGGPSASGARQHLESGGSAGAVILAGGWNRSAGAVGAKGGIWLSIGFRNRDGTTTWRNLYYPTPAHDWVHEELRAVADKAYASIDVYAMQSNTAGPVEFDGITLWALT